MITDQFIERLIAKTITTGERSRISIRPAITPDVLPETLYLPEQRFIHSTSAAYSKVPISSSTEAADDAAVAAAAAAAPTDQRITSRRDVPDIRGKDVETRESEKKSNEPAKEPAITSVDKDISIITDLEPKDDSTHRESEGLRGRPPPETVVVMPRESVERRHEDSSAASSSSKAYDFLQTEKKIEEALHSEPEVTINIGRIEVRAAALHDKPAPKTQQFLPLSLKEYLKQRSEGRL